MSDFISCRTYLRSCVYHFIHLHDALAAEVLSLIGNRKRSGLSHGALQRVHGTKKEMTYRMEVCRRWRWDGAEASVNLDPQQAEW